MMPTPLPEHWDYDRLSGTLFIWNGSSNEYIAKTNYNKTELEFILALPDYAKKIVTDKILKYLEELEEEKQKKREEEINNVLKSIRTSGVTGGN